MLEKKKHDDIHNELLDIPHINHRPPKIFR